MARQAAVWARGGGLLALVLSITVSLALLSSCSPIEPGGAAQLPTAAAPTNVGSAVQYAVLTARQNSSECARVDPAALFRWLLVHVTFDSTLGVPGEGPPKKGLVRCLSRTAH
jgi:hypothetical protein